MKDKEIELKIKNLNKELIEKRDNTNDQNDKKYYRKLTKKLDQILKED